MEKLPELNSRIKEIIDKFEGGNVAKFSQRLEKVSQQRLNRIFNLDTRTKKFPSVPDDVLISIAKSIPKVNLCWLLTGSGEMEQSQASTTDSSLRVEALEREVNTLKDELLATKNELIAMLKRQVKPVEKSVPSLVGF